MFCPQCGKQVNDAAKFCGGCGARIDSLAEEVTMQDVPVPEGPYATPEQGYHYQPESYAAPASNNAGLLLILHIVMIALAILPVIFWFCDGLFVEAWGYRETGSFAEICTDGGEIVTVANVVFSIAIAVLNVLPILTGKIAQRNISIISIIPAFLRVIAVAIVLLVVTGEADSGYYSGISWGLTGAGWLLMLTTLAAVVVPLVIHAKNK